MEHREGLVREGALARAQGEVPREEWAREQARALARAREQARAWALAQAQEEALAQAAAREQALDYEQALLLVSRLEPAPPLGKGLQEGFQEDLQKACLPQEDYRNAQASHLYPTRQRAAGRVGALSHPKARARLGA